MKNIISITIGLLFLIIMVTTTFIKKKEEIIVNNNPFQKYSFYQKELNDEYIKYQKQYQTNDKDTIIRVNIGLNKPFYNNPKAAKISDNYQILVNKYLYLDKNYKPNDLIETTKYSKGGIKLRKQVYESFLQMAEDALKENYHLRIISAYRSYDYQNNLYQKYLEKDVKEVVDTYSARPGYSEHQTGLAIDIDNIYTDYNKFHITTEFNWMKDNAYKYGFILRYPKGKEKITGFKYESWHFRYVGKEIASYIHQHNITFDEYYYEFLYQ